jgi:hypothetical protein
MDTPGPEPLDTTGHLVDSSAAGLTLDQAAVRATPIRSPTIASDQPLRCRASLISAPNVLVGSFSCCFSSAGITAVSSYAAHTHARLHVPSYHMGAMYCQVCPIDNRLDNG